MKLEIGKSYRSRNGQTFQITNMISNSEGVPIYQDCNHNNRAWFEHGGWFEYSENELDLISEITTGPIMNIKQIDSLIDAVFQGTHTSAEYNRVHNWFAQNPVEVKAVGLNRVQKVILTQAILEITNDSGILVGEQVIYDCIDKFLNSWEFDINEASKILVRELLQKLNLVEAQYKQAQAELARLKVQLLPEIGSIWEYENAEVEVIAHGSNPANNSKTTVCVKEVVSQAFAVWDLNDFIFKFKLVD